ncbi:monofunctional biosynthetic peptidoglycan transglycosylase [Lutimaribacter sp. EGI FJ00015]|uniref:Monofunctional biosynthetic peptidoglycan transglycosylase n=1 Tax=Lutimaribacter degradans TaxID=2945989 RepID=A0ACC5ZUI5_9RHOB|nr:monofunctional biosynthetic peptidoglycan transglycosylase [Lutimaribacter sp. EGI FJ00013]MCM2561853.1 monofunctional biosynthetic peptidoglycan transglycosylase [Lutimaribacter sp. EGI FJ00013]MCO0613115.1 monofunctional biosynthetic peptidoglycan transglycosylase [Lutimaribacter sp. EGI FJ00015]MCO0635685.1 monofunctional biosynthetic peptidoglycan transglycosylase [Lutimaribacter sp. EGI FJ00014]
MARSSNRKTGKSKRKTAAKPGADPVRAAFRVGISPLRWLRRWVLRGLLAAVLLLTLWIVAYGAINPPTTPYILSEKRRLGAVDRIWVPFDAVAPVMARSVVAAEDANFCAHWGFDMSAIRAALEDGGRRGASTISQQVVKNAYLWQGRNWARKALEAVMTPAVEAAWSKRRILEVYLNIVEFDEGIFGVEAAARHYFGVGPDALSAAQAARLAAVLPNPKARDAARPGAFVQRRAASIMDGAETIRRDGRAACFED